MGGVATNIRTISQLKNTSIMGAVLKCLAFGKDNVNQIRTVQKTNTKELASIGIYKWFRISHTSVSQCHWPEQHATVGRKEESPRWASLGAHASGSTWSAISTLATCTLTTAALTPPIHAEPQTLPMSPTAPGQRTPLCFKRRKAGIRVLTSYTHKSCHKEICEQLVTLELWFPF